MKKLIAVFLFLLTFSILSAQSGEQYLVTSQTLNMRSGEGTNYDIIGKLSQGDFVTILEKKESGWWYVDFQKLKGYVFYKYLKVDPYRGWEKTNYKSGATPNCENIVPKYDFEIDNYLRIYVGSNTDVVVKLMKIGNYSDECIRIVYVRSKDSYEIKNIPQGKYYLKIAYGKDYRQKIIDNQCYVKFMKNAIYEKGTDTLNFNLIKLPDSRIGNNIYENWDIPIFELSLDVIEIKGIESTFKSSNISEEEFNQ